MQDKLVQRFYTSIHDFSKDMLATLNEAIELQTTNEFTEAPLHNGDAAQVSLTHDLKQKKALAKRITRAVQGLLEDALAKESQLRRKPVEQELSNLDKMLKEGLTARSNHGHGLTGNGKTESDENYVETVRKDVSQLQRTETVNGESEIDPEIDPEISNASQKGRRSKSSKKSSRRFTPEATPLTNGVGYNAHDLDKSTALSSSQTETDGGKGEPPTPPLSTGDDGSTLIAGGVPWYMESFAPDGTTIFEEQWSNPKGPRSMSDELSDMDEEELSGLVSDKDIADAPSAVRKAPRAQAKPAVKASKAALRRKKRLR